MDSDADQLGTMARLSEKLGRKKEAAIVELLSQRNVEEAARAAGVGARTLYRWMKEADFDAAYRAARRAAFSQSAARLQQMCSAAVTTLGKIMVDPTSPVASRVRAADSVLDHAAKSIELEDIDVRVSELERAAEAAKSR
jgi:transposase-like protein